MSSSYGRVIWCEQCGELVAQFRVSGGATAAGVAESGSIDAEAVIADIGTALVAGSVKTLRGRCWVCVCADEVLAEPFEESTKGKRK